MANTTNFGWETPDDTDLVKDGAASIRTLGSAIDTSLVDLKGGTTGQVLSKASNTDMDFSWVAQDDSNAIQNAIVDAKGDLITATAADTPARLAVGTNGQVLQADSTTATGLKWADSSSGSMTLISTTTLTGSSINLTSIPTTYNDLRVIIRNYRPANDATRIRMRFNNDSNGRYSGQNAWGLSTASLGMDQTEMESVTGNSDADAATSSFSILHIPDYANTTTWKTMTGWSGVPNSGTPTNVNANQNYWWYNQTAAITELNFFTSNGNFTSGTIYLYGVK